MKRILILLTVLIGLTIESFAQCKIQTTHRPDNNTIKYFNPTPVIRQSDYEVGIALYKNITSNELSLNIFVLFKEMSPKDLTGDVVLQTTNVEGIRLNPILSKMIKMNGRDVAIGQYKIDQRTFEELKNYNLKSIFFYVDSELVGSTVTENRSVLKKQIKCFIENGILTTDSKDVKNIKSEKIKPNVQEGNPQVLKLMEDLPNYDTGFENLLSKHVLTPESLTNRGYLTGYENPFQYDGKSNGVVITLKDRERSNRNYLILLFVIFIIVIVTIYYSVKGVLKNGNEDKLNSEAEIDENYKQTNEIEKRVEELKNNNVEIENLELKKEYYINQVEELLMIELQQGLNRNPFGDSPFGGLMAIKILGDTVELVKEKLSEIIFLIEGELLFDVYEVRQIVLAAHTNVYNKVIDKSDFNSDNYIDDNENNSDAFTKIVSDVLDKKMDDMDFSELKSFTEILTEHSVRMELLKNKKGPAFLANLLTERYFSNYYVKSELALSAKELIKNFYMMHYGGRKVKKVNKIAEKFKDNLPLVILYVYYYEIKKDEDLVELMFNEIEIFYKIILETYNVMCPEDKKQEYSFSPEIEDFFFKCIKEKTKKKSKKKHHRQNDDLPF